MRIVLIVLIAIATAACGPNDKADASVVPQSRNRPSGEVQANPTLLKQLTIGAPEWGSVAATIRVPGRVEADQTRLARINSPVTGRITDVRVNAGDTVTRGQILAMMYSTELSSIESAFVKAISQQQLAKQAAERAKLLLDAGVIGQAEVQRREAEVVQASAELSAFRDQLRVLGFPDESIEKLQKTRAVSSIIPLVATIDGTVLERKATTGQIMQPAETVFVLADLTNTWLIADLPEQIAGDVAPGRIVEAEIAALPGHPVRGRLSHVSPIVDPETRTIRTRMNLPNPHRRYKPAMLATIVLKDEATRRRVVPDTAVVREGNRDHVFVQTNADTFVLRPVQLSEASEGNKVVESGLDPDEKIVLDGAFHLNNERNRIALQGG